EPLHRRNAAARLALVERALAGARGRLLDVGCALGDFPAAATAHGFEASGVEVSAWARQRAIERHGLEVHPSLEAAVAGREGTFDVVSFFQVLEHMPRPDEALALARRALVPGGLLVLETWDASSLVARVAG